MSTEIGICRPATLRLTLSCDLAEVRPAAQEVAAFLAAQGCGDDEITACGLALAEACNNAINYTPAESRSLPLHIEALLLDDAVEIRVHDRTRGFDWPAEIALPDLESESGRGLYIIDSVSDQAGYLRGQDFNTLYFRHARVSKAAPLAPDDGDQVLTQMVEELSSCYESLSAIFRHSAATHETGKLKNFAQRLLDDLLLIVGAEWYLLRLASSDKSRLESFASSDALPGLVPVMLSTPSGSIEAGAALNRQQMWFDTRSSEMAGQPITQLRPDSQGVVHPIYASGDLVGTLVVGKRTSAEGSSGLSTLAAFTASQTNVIGTLADFLAIQVVNARSQEDQMRAHAVQREMEIASSIQRSLLLKELPRLPGIQISAHCENARQVGGDFYDVLRVGDSSLLIMIADVMGKGMPAALFAATLRTALRSAPELFQQPAQLLTRANRLLHDELSSVDMFITAQLALLDASNRRLTVASAGHCPLLYCASGSPESRAISPEGLPLGVRLNTVFEEETLSLPNGFRLLLCTDGLCEAINGERERYGQLNLERWFRNAARNGATASDLNAALIAEMRRFRGGLPLEDDQTFLVMTHNPEH